MMTEKEKKLWKNCIEFHGHQCGGLVIGFKAALYAKELADAHRSEDEELVCIAENDACGIDGIQFILGCTIGKGNLLFRLRGKQAFNFYSKETGKSFRLLLKEDGFSREDMLDLPNEDLFQVMDTKFKLPEKARIFQSYSCEICGEKTADYFMRFQDGKKVCLDCFKEYSRF